MQAPEQLNLGNSTVEWNSTAVMLVSAIICHDWLVLEKTGKREKHLDIKKKKITPTGISVTRKKEGTICNNP